VPAARHCMYGTVFGRGSRMNACARRSALIAVQVSSLKSSCAPVLKQPPAELWDFLLQGGGADGMAVQDGLRRPARRRHQQEVRARALPAGATGDGTLSCYHRIRLLLQLKPKSCWRQPHACNACCVGSIQAGCMCDISTGQHVISCPPLACLAPSTGGVRGHIAGQLPLCGALHVQRDGSLPTAHGAPRCNVIISLYLPLLLQCMLEWCRSLLSGCTHSCCSPIGQQRYIQQFFAGVHDWAGRPSGQHEAIRGVLPAPVDTVPRVRPPHPHILWHSSHILALSI
jgi:hypothetical protein